MRAFENLRKYLYLHPYRRHSSTPRPIEGHLPDRRQCVPLAGENRLRRYVPAVAPVPLLWKSAGYSNQVDLSSLGWLEPRRLAKRF
jgi:hypothetical protein